MKKIMAIILAILVIQVFNLINFTSEPLPEAKSQLLNIVLVTIYSITALGISIYFRVYSKTKKYVIETESLPSPILAEAIVDGKIGMKKLIFSAVVEFTLRENIRNVDGDTFELVNTNNLEPFEKSILELIFQENNIIQISNLEDILTNSKEKINEIKEKILEELYEKNIFNYLLTKINQLIAIISLFVLINLPLIFKITNMWIPLALLNLSLCIYYYRKYIKNQTHEEIIMEESIADKHRMNKRFRHSSMTHGEFRLLVIVGYIMIFKEIFNGLSLFFRNNIIYFILFLINIFISIYIISKSNHAVFTVKGRYIQKNLKKLINYIKDYNLINEEKIKSVNLWDKYLAYALAFGIRKNTLKIKKRHNHQLN